MRHKLFIFRVVIAVCCFLGGTNFSYSASSMQDELAGKRIYANLCAGCHGDRGQGNPEQFPDPLIGSLTRQQLEALISQTMPEESPDDCIHEDAESVARFVFDEFYSKGARQRQSRPRIELSHLTVRQYRESVADLVGTFGNSGSQSDERGLSANYFAARNWTKDRKLAQQVDATIDFGDGVPWFDPSGKYESLAKIDEKKLGNIMNVGFSAHWNGSLIPPVTGMYEIVVESKNGFTLWINNMARPLIDRRVRSDRYAEHKAAIFLLAGRRVSVKLGLFSYPDPPARIRLMWKPPGRPLAVVPESSLAPHQVPELAIVSTMFPADDSSAGYKRGVMVSRQWDASTTSAAIEVANWVALRIWKLSGSKPTAGNANQKARQFCRQFVERAYSVRLNNEEFRFFVGQFFDQDISIEDRVRRVVMMTLKSPRFLYPSIGDREPADEISRRMAIGFWDSVPDSRLSKKASAGELIEPPALDQELARMADDIRSKQKLVAFFEEWLDTGDRGMAKDKTMFPKYDEEMAADMQTSLALYLDDVVWGGDSDFRDLFLADYLYVNANLAEFMDLDFDPEGPKFQKIHCDPKTRAGLLTHPYLMTGLAYFKESSPIHRGVFVAKRFLGRRLRQPPNAVAPLEEAFDPSMTVRQRVEYQTRETTCMSCHRVINPLGFSLENFDAVGRFREKGARFPIDAASVYTLQDGTQIDLVGSRDLAKFLAQDETVQRNFIRQLFRYYVKQPIEAFGPAHLDQLHAAFVESDFDIRELLINVVRVSVLQGSE